MSEGKFTQGDWDYFISDNGNGFPIIFVGDIDIAEIYLPNGNGEEMLANAQLIKTAPKMYKRLKFLESDLWALQKKSNNEKIKDFLEDRINKINELLKEARGGR